MPLFARFVAVMAFLLVTTPRPMAAASTPPAADPPSTSPDATTHRRRVIGLSPFLAGEDKDPVYRAIVRFVLEDMELGSTLVVYDAYRLRTVARIDLPQVRAFRSARTRANQFGAPLLALRQFLAASHPPPVVPGLDFERAVQWPRFLDFVGESRGAPPSNVEVLILGSPLHLDEKEPGFSMTRGSFPSDGHLLASRERSIYGTADRDSNLEGVVVHACWFGDPWTNDLHRDRLLRFWTLFVSRQGGRLGAFSGDLPTVFEAFRDRPADDARPGRDLRVEPQAGKIEMLRITREIGATDWIRRDDVPNAAHTPPSITVGPMKIGIRWRGPIDLDLYARPEPNGERLYFEHTRVPQGYYHKDHRTSPDREFEFVEFVEPVDLRKVEAAVNFYDGFVPEGPVGEVRIEFDGRIYTGRFSIAASRGNRGREGEGQQDRWASIDVLPILGLR